MSSKGNLTSGMRPKHFFIILLSALVIFSIIAGAGCENPFSTELIEDNENDSYGNLTGDNDSIPEIAETPDEEKSLNVAIFFGDNEAINTGATGEYGYVKEVTQSISYNENGEELLYKTLNLLIAGPDGEGSEVNEDNGLSAVISDETEIIDIIIDEDNNAVVNLSREAGESSGGTLGGIIFTQAMVYTATQFPFVETLEVLVEGSPWSDGHTFWENPIGRDDL